jgi:drug/metabolite transporter (DMT)-like permease
MMVAASAILGVTDAQVVRIAAEAGLWQFHAVRSAMALPLLLIVAWAGLGRIRPRHPGRLAVRTALVACAILIYFGSLGFLPLAQAMAGLFTAPVFVVLLSWAVLRQPVSALQALAVGVGFAGILLVLRPEAGALSPLAALPVLAGFLYGAGALATRHLCAEENVLALVFGFFVALGLMGLAGLGVLTLWPQDPPPGPTGFILRGLTPLTPGFLVWTAVQAVGSLVAVGLIARAYQTARPGFVAVFENSVLAFGAAAGWVFWGQAVGPVAVAGIVLIVVAGTLVTLRRGG